MDIAKTLNPIGKSGVTAQVQLGKTNSQTLGKTQIETFELESNSGKIETGDTEVKTESVETLVQEDNSNWWIWLILFLVAWEMPRTSDIYKRIKNKWYKPKGTRDTTQDFMDW